MRDSSAYLLYEFRANVDVSGMYVSSTQKWLINMKFTASNIKLT